MEDLFMKVTAILKLSLGMAAMLQVSTILAMDQISELYKKRKLDDNSCNNDVVTKKLKFDEKPDKELKKFFELICTKGKQIDALKMVLEDPFSMVLKNRSLLNRQDEHGNTGLMHLLLTKFDSNPLSPTAPSEDDLMIIRHWCGPDVDLNVKNENGETALLIALSRSQEIAKIIIENGANPNELGSFIYKLPNHTIATNKNISPLAAACYWFGVSPNRPVNSCVQQLIHAGADVDVECKIGMLIIKPRALISRCES